MSESPKRKAQKAANWKIWYAKNRDRILAEAKVKNSLKAQQKDHCKACVRCQGVFEADDAHAIYCDSCRKEKLAENSRRGALAHYYRKRQEKLSILFTCLHCGKSFQRERLDQQLCSDECRRLRVNANHRKHKHVERAYVNRRHREDPVFRLRKLVRNRVNMALKGRSVPTSTESILKYLPFTIEELRAHLESFFTRQNGFTWKNHGKLWHIDHIIPQVAFNYDSVKSQAFRDCWSLTNLRPEFAIVNLKKGAKIGYFDKDGQKSFIA